jgi:phosphoenolpyruvate carboxylase
MYLQQLGKTPFLNKEKPTPYDEAMSLLWFLENIFYGAAGRMVSFMESQFPEAVNDENPIIKMGFWPGGDRDGNPNVTADTTIKVAEALRGSIVKCYYLDVRRLKRRLTFKGVDTILSDLEKQLYNNIFIPGQRTELTKEKILEELKKVKEIVIYQHNGLFQSLVENLINKVHVFGMHFASLDVRQESSEHTALINAVATKEDILPKNYSTLSEPRKWTCSPIFSRPQTSICMMSSS